MQKITFQDINNKILISIDNSFNQEDYLTLFDTLEKALLSKGKHTLLFNCENISEFPSIAFGIFCRLSRECKKVQGSFTLVKPSNAIIEMMQKIHITKLVPVTDKVG